MTAAGLLTENDPVFGSEILVACYYSVNFDVDVATYEKICCKGHVDCKRVRKCGKIWEGGLVGRVITRQKRASQTDRHGISDLWQADCE